MNISFLNVRFVILLLICSCTNYKDREFTINSGNEENCKIEIQSNLINDELKNNVQILKCTESNKIYSFEQKLDSSCKEYFFDVYDLDFESYVKKRGIMCYQENVGWEIIY